MKKYKVTKQTVGIILFSAFLFLYGCAGKKNLVVEEQPLSETNEVVELSEKAPAPDEINLLKENVEEKALITPPALLLREIKKYKKDQKVDESAPYFKDKEKPVEIEQAVNADEILAPKEPPGDETAHSLPQMKKSVTKTGDVVLNFDKADLNEVIKTMAGLLKINYIIGQEVQGRVTINTVGMLRKEDLFPVFFQILEANGLTAVKEGSLYKIVKIKQAIRMSIPSRFGREDEGTLSGENIIMQIIPLKNISAAEMTQVLKPFISTEGTIISHKDSNTLLMVDKNINIIKALKLVEVFDVDIFKNVNHRFFLIKNIDVGEMLKLLNDIMSAYQDFSKAKLKLIGISRLNTILAVSRNPGLFDKLESFIRQLDIPGDSISEPNIYVYSVKNGEASELATLLTSVISDQSGSDGDRQDVGEKVQGAIPRNPFAKEIKETKGIQETKEEKIVVTRRKTAKLNSGTMKGKINIIPDTIRNALIIKAVPSDYRTIYSILDRIDVLPRQVLISVTIAEITLDDSSKLGVEWSYIKGNSKLTSNLLEANVSSSGLTFTVGMIDRWSSILEALATENKVNILSSPSVLASDNKEAKIDISTEIPVASSQYQHDSDSSAVIETSIEYRNTGVILSVTPHINERGLVSMDINQEVSEQSQNILVGDKEYPSFFKRSVLTSLTVNDGQTIAIGGLIRETKSDGTSGIPLLSRIPIIGFLFGRDTKSLSKTELIILITPRVITSLEDVDTVTQEFKRKTRNAMKFIE
ncbi:MAG: type II secretion system secretin GspD [Desulfobacterales bacterium]|nr:type II secretion system secretin GspD [Desulfobacterales bacterium]